MAREESLGFIETRGFIGAVEAADAMAKAAMVEIIRVHKVGSARIAVICEGSVASCQAAVEAGVAAAERAGCTVLVSNVIPRPDEGTSDLVDLMLDEMRARKAARRSTRRRKGGGGEEGGGGSEPTEPTAPTAPAAPAPAPAKAEKKAKKPGRKAGK